VSPVVAVLAGATAAVVFLLVWRKARRAALVAIVVGTAVVIWAHYRR